MLQFFPLRSPSLPPIGDRPFAFNLLILVLSVTTFCLLSTFCCFTIAINCFFWFFTNIIGGGITKLKEEIFNMLNREGKTFTESGSTTFRNMARGNNGGIEKNYSEMRGFNYLHSDRRYVLAPAELSYKRCEKKNSKSNEQHTPDIPSPLNPKRPKDLLKDVEHYPSERHLHRSISKSKLSLTDRMIESTAAYRVGKQCYGWQDVNFENCVIKKTQHEIQSHHQRYSFPSPGQPPVLVTCTKPYDLRGYRINTPNSEHIRDLNVRLDQERPNLVRHDRLMHADHSPLDTLQHARKCLDDLTASKR